MHPPELGVDRLLSNSDYGRFDPRRAVLGLTASLRLLTGYLTGWNSKTTHVYAPPYGFTPPTPPKRLPHKCGVPKLAGTPHLCGSAPKMRIAAASQPANWPIKLEVTTLNLVVRSEEHTSELQ